MYRVTREMKFCYGHRLINYEGKCRHLHGHNGRVLVTLESPTLDHRGMLIDFADIKAVLQQWIDDTLDHTMLLCKDDPLVPILRERGERHYVMETNPTAENIARLIFERGREAGLPIVEVTLWETDTCHASFQGPLTITAVDVQANANGQVMAYG
jgi:6-pyruvoyltetrahydropterin/6-carboxytetrahydropterin synthase